MRKDIDHRGDQTETVASDDPTGRAIRAWAIVEEARRDIESPVAKTLNTLNEGFASLFAAPAPAWDTRATVPDVEDLTARLAAADVAWGREVGDGPASPNYISFLARQAVAFEPAAAPAPNGDVYVHLVGDRPKSARQREVSPGVVLDFDVDGRPIGVEVLGATSVEVDGSPVAVPAAQPDPRVAELRSIARDLDETRQEWRDTDNRTLRSSALGHAVAVLRDRADEIESAALAALRGKQQ